MYNSTSVIGLSKNAGKTTLLNHLIKRFEMDKRKLGLTSIGIDGENQDVWSKKAKPPIFISEGTIVATTAEGMRAGTATWRILEKLSIPSSFGNIYLAEATSPGNVKIVGIPVMDYLQEVLHTFKQYGIEEMLVDGAYDRLSSANPLITNQTYLAIGASLHQQEDMFWNIVYDKLYSFFYPEVYDMGIRSLTEQWINKSNVIIKKKQNLYEHPSTYLLSLDNQLDDDIDWLLIPGVLTEQMLLKMLKQKKAWNIVLQHGLKSFVSVSLAERWKNRGGTIQVLYPIQLKGIAYNPYSPNGYSFSAEGMKEKLIGIRNDLTREKIPIFDIWRDELPK